MNNLIERDRAMKVAMWFGRSEQKYHHSFIKKRVMEIPSARPKKGEWIYTNNPLRLDDEWECSKCGNISFMRTNFCARCGAHMKGVDDERQTT